jgi:outer membrane protein
MKKLILACILLLLGSPHVFSQTVISTVNEAIELAKKQNADLQISQQNARIQSWNVTATQSTRIPQLKFTTALDYNFVLPTQLIPAQFFGGKEGEFRGVQFGVPLNLTAGLEASVPLWNAGLKQDIQLAQQNQKLTDLQTLVLSDDLSTQVARLYFATVFTQQYLRLLQQNLANADSIVAIARARKDKGLIDQLEYNRSRATRLNVEDVLRQNELAYAKNLNQLRLLLHTQDFMLAPYILPASLPAAKETVGEGHPKLQLRAQQLVVAQAQLKKEKLLRLPTLSAFTRYQEQAQRSTFNFLNFNEKWYGIGVAGLRFEVPIYTARLRESAIGRAQVNADIAKLQLDNEKRKFQSETDELLLNYRQAVSSLKTNEEAYQLSQQNLQLVLIKYQGGILSYDQYLNVFNEALNAQNKYLRTLADVMINGKLLELRN